MVIIMYFLNCFFIYSILGYFLEMIFGYLMGFSAESGVLYGPWTPIYGFASIMIIVLSSSCFKNLHLPRWIETIIVFVLLTVLISLLEFIGGYLIEFIFDFSFWDYSNRPFHLGKYVCLEFSLLWGILSVIFIYILNPFVNRIINKIPKWMTIMFYILLFVDFFYRIFVEFKQ